MLTRMLALATVLAGLAVANPLPAFAGGADGGAKHLTIVLSEANEPLKLTRTEGSPVTFEAHWTQQMPTPGWKFEIDAVEITEDRIVVRVTENRPTGMSVQMIAPGTAMIPLGSLNPGRYVLEIRSRREPDGAHAPVFATVIWAR